MPIAVLTHRLVTTNKDSKTCYLEQPKNSGDADKNVHDRKHTGQIAARCKISIADCGEGDTDSGWFGTEARR